MQLFPHFEAIITSQHPGDSLTFRNMGWSGDEVALQPRPLNFGDMHTHLAEQGTVIVKFWLNVSKKEQRERLVKDSLARAEKERLAQAEAAKKQKAEEDQARKQKEERRASAKLQEELGRAPTQDHQGRQGAGLSQQVGDRLRIGMPHQDLVQHGAELDRATGIVPNGGGNIMNGDFLMQKLQADQYPSSTMLDSSEKSRSHCSSALRFAGLSRTSASGTWCARQ